ncbi:MAG: NAD(P)/FAD-dependent oxidoreductase [Caldilineales bacterium]|nr:NAD(P)/FAD-dependent oxidoreductase [Caldilineales bacterium]
MAVDIDYDVVVVGGSFAGLAVAMQLRGRRVLIVDQYPIGSHQISACGTPLTTARAVGAQASTLETHNTLALHAAGKTIHFPLKDPYITFDYRAFCQAMLRQTDAEVWQVRGTALDARQVETSNGPVDARFVVNASGWRAHPKEIAPDNRQAHPAGYGLETELPLRWQDPGLHFYFIKQWVRNGYAWIFPCGGTTRFGIGSFNRNDQLRPALDRFLSHLGLKSAQTHGGVLAIGRRQPLHEGVFLVGDAAGQCLPVTGEGIRTAIFHGLHCGRAIARALAGDLNASQARHLYALQVRSMDRFHRRLLTLQTIVAHTPEPLLAAAARVCARPSTIDWIMTKYWVHSGWFAAPAT